MTAFLARSAAAVAALAAAATLVPATASAQSYGYGQSYNQGYGQSYNQGYGQSQRYGNTSGYQDRCQTLGQGRTGAGALIGGGLGAVAGSQIAGRGNRTGASIIGGVLGAVIGAQVGRASNDQCRSDGYAQGQSYGNSAYAPPAQYYSDRDRYDDRASSANRYDERAYGQPQRYDDRRNDARNGYAVSDDGFYYYDPRRGWLPR
ncbi:MAG: glycine zipper 2TM domain-containing protein [Brevundimonas sp.]|uniref:glycine zipper 2TM domain-containing protein n=1 Tax=Brevundimonas sp. TaxID=1871086 RepID=UPI0027326AAB|nr:glycine zipper 2TM domain-containing protein [Brevundimonas sp.]MDP3403880.1 glycine zipper 2TM domain-containing protein [Brevundimonas sp.]